MFILPLFAVLAALSADKVFGTCTATHGSHGNNPPAFQATCEQFGAKLKIQNAHIHSVTYVPIGGSLNTTQQSPSCIAEGLGLEVNSSFSFCRIQLNVTTSPQSQIYMEAWLPSNYSGRFLSTGNGGLGGCVMYPDMLYAAQYGFATVGTNNGHFGDTGQFFYHNSDVVEDFAYRAVHTGVVVGKEIVRQFYSQGFTKSYYLGCSTGGRQGWKSVQKFPNDFDGVVAGSPAFNFVNLINWGARFYPTTGSPKSDRFLSAAEWGVVHAEILRQCDDLDGAADGIIEDPDLCQPVFETLLCRSSAAKDKNQNCLTAAQVNTVNTVFSPLYGIGGSWLYPRMQPGSELSAAFTYYTGMPFNYAEDWFRYVVYGNPSWDPATWTVSDAAKADAQDPYEISTWNGDISAFQKTGGKVLHYHGMEDPIITSESSKAYYKHAITTMQLDPSSLDEFYRFFPISGMGHCQGGSGASAIGQGLGTPATSGAEDNVLLAMVQWVEKEIAPEYIRGTKYNGTVAEFTRKHCKYPKHNKYIGPGAYTDENAWKCV